MHKYYQKNIHVFQHDSKYNMGSDYKLDDDECEDSAVAREIIIEMELVKDSIDIDLEADEFVNKFNRPDGLIARLNTFLEFNLEAFNKQNKTYKYERCKILYLFYMLENKYFPKTNILMLLSKPSMENIDYSSLGIKTYNGMFIKLIKDALEKELSLITKQKIKTTLTNIVSTWDEILQNATVFMDFLYENGCEYDFEDTIWILNNTVESEQIEAPLKYTHSSIETLYLKIM